MDADVAKVYGNKVRVRACGICWQGDHILMVNHRGITDQDFWAPPGGGVEFGESVHETLKHEFLEETGLHVSAGPYLFGCEYIQKPIHSVELFFQVTHTGGRLKTGKDPEIDIIEQVCYMPFSKILSMPASQVHGIFRLITNPTELMQLRGFFKI